MPCWDTLRQGLLSYPDVEISGLGGCLGPHGSAQTGGCLRGNNFTGGDSRFLGSVAAPLIWDDMGVIKGHRNHFRKFFWLTSSTDDDLQYINEGNTQPPVFKSLLVSGDACGVICVGAVWSTLTGFEGFVWLVMSWRCHAGQQIHRMQRMRWM